MGKAAIFSIEAMLGLVTAATFLLLVQAMPASEVSYSSIRQYQLLQDAAEVGVRNERPLFENWDNAKIEEFYAPLMQEAAGYCLEVVKRDTRGNQTGTTAKTNCEKQSYATTMTARRLLYANGEFYYTDFYLRQ